LDFLFVTFQKKVTKVNPADGGKINIAATELILISTANWYLETYFFYSPEANWVSWLSSGKPRRESAKSC
jgi:hypothetical protein